MEKEGPRPWSLCLAPGPRARGTAAASLSLDSVPPSLVVQRGEERRPSHALALLPLVREKLAISVKRPSEERWIPSRGNGPRAAAPRGGGRRAFAVVGFSIVVSNFGSFIISLYCPGLFLGIIYSVPPFKVKKYPVAAFLIIAKAFRGTVMVPFHVALAVALILQTWILEQAKYCKIKEDEEEQQQGSGWRVLFFSFLHVCNPQLWWVWSPEAQPGAAAGALPSGRPMLFV